MNVIREYRRGDMERIKGRDDFSALVANAFDGEPDRDRTWTLAADNWSAAACGGYVEERPGVYMLWGYCSAGLRRADWLTIRAEVREIVSGLFAAGAHRVHGLARADNAAAIRYLMCLGLRHDANRLVMFGPEGEDYVLLAALKGLGRGGEA